MALTSLESISEKLAETKKANLETLLIASGSAAVAKNEFGVTVVDNTNVASSLVFKNLSKLDNFNLEFNNNIICSCNNTNYLDDMPLNIILKNESGINNIGNSCYFNSTLHLIAPIITNIIYNSDKSKFNYEIELKKIHSENYKNKELVQIIGEKSTTEVESTKEKLFFDRNYN